MYYSEIIKGYVIEDVTKRVLKFISKLNHHTIISINYIIDSSNRYVSVIIYKENLNGRDDN